MAIEDVHILLIRLSCISFLIKQLWPKKIFEAQRKWRQEPVKKRNKYVPRGLRTVYLKVFINQFLLNLTKAV